MRFTLEGCRIKPCPRSHLTVGPGLTSRPATEQSEIGYMKNTNLMLLEQSFHNAQNKKFRSILLPAMLSVFVEQKKQKLMTKSFDMALSLFSEEGYNTNDLMLFNKGSIRTNILIQWHHIL